MDSIPFYLRYDPSQSISDSCIELERALSPDTLELTLTCLALQGYEITVEEVEEDEKVCQHALLTLKRHARLIFGPECLLQCLCQASYIAWPCRCQCSPRQLLSLTKPSTMSTRSRCAYTAPVSKLLQAGLGCNQVFAARVPV